MAAEHPWQPDDALDAEALVSWRNHPMTREVLGYVRATRADQQAAFEKAFDEADERRAALLRGTVRALDWLLEDAAQELKSVYESRDGSGEEEVPGE